MVFVVPKLFPYKQSLKWNPQLRQSGFHLYFRVALLFENHDIIRLILNTLVIFDPQLDLDLGRQVFYANMKDTFVSSSQISKDWPVDVVVADCNWRSWVLFLLRRNIYWPPWTLYSKRFSFALSFLNLKVISNFVEYHIFYSNL